MRDVGISFHSLVEAVAEQYDLDHDQALRFIGESCNAGGPRNPEEEPKLLEELREAARHEPDVDWLTERTEARGAPIPGPERLDVSGESWQALDRPRGVDR